jgi:uncharacterized protein (DUF362 family)
MLDPRVVAVAKSDIVTYPSQAPFHPSSRYPDYRFGVLSEEMNAVYESVRDCFRLMGLDARKFDTPDWNPLGELIHPGETVLLKPNLVKETHPRDADGWLYTLTNGSVVRAVADYVWRALDGRGKMILADAPQTDTSWERVVHILGLDTIRDFYQDRGVDFELVDLRQEEWENRGGVIVARRPLAGDPYGYVDFDLAQKSEFVGHGGAGHYYGADYDSAEVNYHHSGGRHQYRVAGSAILCDAVFSLPKLKTHKKAGITVSLKNLVGVNGDKNWLPHHTEGNPEQGGDEHPNPSASHRFERAAAARFRDFALHTPGIGPWVLRRARRVGTRVFGDTEDVIRSGNWWGNDTAWRMCLDLNKIILYGDGEGILRTGGSAALRRHLVLVDGVVAGEGRGPMNPDPVHAGIVAFGLHPASTDAACAYLIGFDPDRIPIVRQAFCCRELPLAGWDWREVKVVSNQPSWNGPITDIPDSETFHFRPHFGWAGHIERYHSKSDYDRER